MSYFSVDRKSPSLYNGFDSGDLVVLEVSRKTNTIRYLVNGKLQTTDAIRIGKIFSVFMPFVEM